MRNGWTRLAGVAVIALVIFAPVAGRAQPLHPFMGTTTLVASGSMADAFSVDHDLFLDGVKVSSSARESFLVISGAATYWRVAMGDGTIEGWDGNLTLQPGTYYVYVAEAPDATATVSLHFRDEPGQAAYALERPVAASIGEMTPSTLPAAGIGVGLNQFTSRQPFPGSAFGGMLAREDVSLGPQVHNRETRWTTSNGVYACFATIGEATVTLGDTVTLVAAFDDHGHEGAAQLDYIRNSVAIMHDWRAMGFWIERLTEDPPPLWADAHPPPLWGISPIDTDVGCVGGLIGRALPTFGVVSLDMSVKTAPARIRGA